MYLQLKKFNTITTFLNFCNKHRTIKSQISILLSKHFPDTFSSISLFKQLNMLLNSNKIKDSDIKTYIIQEYQTNHVVAFGQLNKEKYQTPQTPQKIKVINLCRDKETNTYKGQGAKLLHILEHDMHVAKINNLYLSVNAHNTQLQEYYSALGWINTQKYDAQCNSPMFEFVKKI